MTPRKTKIVPALLTVGDDQRPVLAHQERSTPYEWDCQYTTVPDSFLDRIDCKEMPREAWRLLRWLWRAMDVKTNWARFGSYRRLGEDAGGSGDLMDASRVCKMIAWLADHDYLIRPPGGGKLFINPELVFRGGGALHAGVVADYRRWRAGLNRKPRAACAATLASAATLAAQANNVVVMTEGRAGMAGSRGNSSSSSSPGRLSGNAAASAAAAATKPKENAS